MDILDVNLGATLFLAERATLAFAVVIPTRGSNDRTFDWEGLVQLNLYFGGSASTGRAAPNF
jgi:hypothetical protein